MSPKKSLLQECENIRRVLEETLRYKYGLDGSREFFEECETRRKYIEQEINNANDNDHEILEVNVSLLNELSRLISRIERSSLGEYSWPFVEELKNIATAICKEDTLTGKDTPPKVYVLSDGGLDAYCIYPEKNRPIASTKRILTIVFPSTLKHFVLLHPILGHEIGHAIWGCSKHQNELKKIILDTLINTGGKFTDPATTTKWLYTQTHPAEVQSVLNGLNNNGINESNFFKWASWDAWVEEILCDLIGLLTFGPSFVAAQCRLLYTIRPSGVGFGQAHPPVGSRVNMIINAAKILKFNDVSGLHKGDLKNSVTDFWENIDSNIQNNSWYDIFSDKQLTSALKEISLLLKKHPPTLYEQPSTETQEKLFTQISNKIPPVGFNIINNEVNFYPVDFRHILYLGWITAQKIPEDLFHNHNRLCEHAIMQQRGINQFLKGK